MCNDVVRADAGDEGARASRAVDVAVTHADDRTGGSVQIRALGRAFDRFRADLDAIVGVYRKVSEGAYRVSWHREAALQHVAAQARGQGHTVAWGGWQFLRQRAP